MDGRREDKRKGGWNHACGRQEVIFQLVALLFMVAGWKGGGVEEYKHLHRNYLRISFFYVYD